MRELEHPLVLFSGPLSMYSAKVRIALREKGLAFREERVPFSFARGYFPKHPQVLAHNPKGQVPVLQWGDDFLYDSTLILEFLEDICPEPALYPTDPLQRALCRKLELESDEVFFALVARLIRANVFGQPLQPGEAETISAGLASHYARLNEHLSNDRFLMGDFTVADIAYVMALHFAHLQGRGFSSAHEALRDWHRRVVARPSVATELNEMRDSLSRLSLNSQTA